MDMKKALAILVLLALALPAACAEAAIGFGDLAGLAWSFSSGAGAWSTDLRIDETGAFSGQFHDGEMGEMGDGYPNGTVYGCAFSGQLALAGQADDGAWIVTVEALVVDGQIGEEAIDDGVRYVTTDPYGITEGDEMRLYPPGTPVDALSEEMRMWAHLNFMDPVPTELPDWFLSSPANDSGFVGYPAVELE